MINRIKFFLLAFCSLWGIPSGMSQTWLPMGKGIDCLYGGGVVRKIDVDTTTDKLYAIGQFVQDGNCVTMRGVSQWDGYYWDSVGFGSQGNASKLGMTIYRDTLFVNGNFYDGNNNFSLGKWNGAFWDTLTNSPEQVWSFAEKDGILYMGGAYDYYLGDSTYMIHKYDGSQFIGEISYCFSGDGGYINALAFYRDTLYVGGYYDMLSCKGFSSLGKWDGSDLHPLGPEFINHGANCNIWCMTEYQGELYIGGYFMQSQGYGGNFIMKWNGVNFSQVGTGMNGRVRCMKVYNNKLYVGGDFTNAGGLPSNCVAMWDGNSWHSISTETFDVPTGDAPSVDAINMYHDTLIIGGHFMGINGDTTCRKVAKYNYALSGIHEQHVNISMRIFPNPASSILTIELNQEQPQNAVLEIKNVFGQTVKSLQLQKGLKKVEVDVSGLSKGVYFVGMRGENQLMVRKFVKE